MKDIPAFPTATLAQKTEGGMTLREYAAIKLKVPDSGTDWLDDMIRQSIRDDFAAKAMQGIFASNAEHDHEDEHIFDAVAEAAYKQADAMLKAREA